MTRFSRQRLQPNRSAGFTLIELLVVILILVLLFAIVVPAFVAARRKAFRVRTSADMETIRTVLEEYKKDHHGRYPASEGLNTGFAVLARELIGVYGDGVTGIPPNTTPDPNDPPAYVRWGSDPADVHVPFARRARGHRQPGTT